jgi:hypothetical protein
LAGQTSALGDISQAQAGGEPPFPDDFCDGFAQPLNLGWK